MVVVAEDVVCAINTACSFLADVAERDWSLAAGDLTWTCRATAEHIASDLIAYAGQLIGEPSSGFVPFDIQVEAEATNHGLVSVIRTTGGLLAAAVATVAASARGWHPHGMGDREAFAAMGIVETFVHTRDIAQGLGLNWSAPEDLCEKVLFRLFPDRPKQDAPWPTLLWCTGRTDLGRLPRQAAWRWQNEQAE